MLIPVPSHEAGIITPQACLSSYVDQLLIPGKLYYGHGDNEGLISTLPAICSVLAGVLAGHWLRSNRSSNRKAIWLAIAGIACLIIGYVWGQFFPIIKNIWTSSFVLVGAGYSLLLLALFYWVIDVKGYKKWAFFFVVIGMNPITIYCLQWLVKFEEIANFFIQGIADHAGIFNPLILAIGVLMVKLTTSFAISCHVVTNNNSSHFCQCSAAFLKVRSKPSVISGIIRMAMRA